MGDEKQPEKVVEEQEEISKTTRESQIPPQPTEPPEGSGEDSK